MANNISNWIAIASFLALVCSNVVWLLTEFQKNNQRKFLQQQRFAELARNQKEIITMIEKLSRK
jgi:hypothetical protein